MQRIWKSPSCSRAETGGCRMALATAAPTDVRTASNPLPRAQLREAVNPILRSPIRWSMLVAALLATAGCGNDDGAKPAGVGGTAGAGGSRPMEITDATMPDRSSAEDSGPGPNNGDSTPGLPDVTTSSDVIATPDARAPDADATTSPADGSAVDTGVRCRNQRARHRGAHDGHGAGDPRTLRDGGQDLACRESNLTVTHIESPNTITDALLANYALILQLNFTPFRWNATAKAAFEKYVTEGKGGWVGMHHSGLYGLGNDPWPWFFMFFGQITYQNYIPTFARPTFASRRRLIRSSRGTCELSRDHRGMVHLGQEPATEHARARERRRKLVHAQLDDQDGRRSSRHLDQRHGQGEERVHFHGPPPELVPERVLRDVAPQRDQLGRHAE